MILGVEPDFTTWNNQQSWRYVDATYTFPDVDKAWPFPEVITYVDIDQDELGGHFTGVKIGDLTGDARANCQGRYSIEEQRGADLYSGSGQPQSGLPSTD